MLRHRGRWKSEQQRLSQGWRGRGQAELVSDLRHGSSKAEGGEAQGATRPTAEGCSSHLHLPPPLPWALGFGACRQCGTNPGPAQVWGRAGPPSGPAADPKGTPPPRAQPRAGPSLSPPGKCTLRKAARPWAQHSAAFTPGRGCPARPPRPPPHRPRAPLPSSAGGGRPPRSSPAPCPA